MVQCLPVPPKSGALMPLLTDTSPHVRSVNSASLRAVRRRGRSVRLLAALCAMFGAIAYETPVAAQQVRVSIDTTKLNADSRAAVRTWRTYLESKRGMYYTNAGMPSPLWVDDEQRRWPMYDLAAAYLPDGGTAEIAAIAPVASSRDFRITTKFAARAMADSSWQNNMTTTVYAVQDGAQWKFANALGRNTASWKRETVKSIEYVYAPEYNFNRARAESAVAFIDSLADVYGVPRIQHLTYYLTNSVDEVYGIMGIELSRKYGATGALAQPVNRQLFSGIPAIGENYRHELAHIVFEPLMTSRTSTFVSEGVPTWYGGTRGLDYPTAVAELATWLRAHPGVTLDSLMRPGYSNEQTYPAAAVVTEMVSDVIGRHGIKLLFDAGATASELREGLQRITRFGWARIQQEWRDRVMDHEKKDH